MTIGPRPFVQNWKEAISGVIPILFIILFLFVFVRLPSLLQKFTGSGSPRHFFRTPGAYDIDATGRRQPTRPRPGLGTFLFPNSFGDKRSCGLYTMARTRPKPRIVRKRDAERRSPAIIHNECTWRTVTNHRSTKDNVIRFRSKTIRVVVVRGIKFYFEKNIWNKCPKRFPDLEPFPNPIQQ